LKVMTFARDVADDLEAVRKTHLGDLAKCRVRLFRGRRVHSGTYAALLRARLKMARLLAVDGRNPRLADQLADSRHCSPFPQSAPKALQTHKSPSRSPFGGGGRMPRQRITAQKDRAAIV